VIAEELGVPRKTLDRWLAETRQHPDEPWVGRGRLPAEDQHLRDLRRRLQDREAEHAIGKKALRLCTHGPK
jgi:transposase